MGLDTTHDCFHGAYSRFMRWRAALAEAVSIVLPYMEGFSGDAPGMLWKDVMPDDPLTELLFHSDCDGILKWENAAALADRLEAIIPLLPKTGEWVALPASIDRSQPWSTEKVTTVEAVCHLLPVTGDHLDEWVRLTEQFVKGLRLAAKSQENVVFH